MVWRWLFASKEQTVVDAPSVDVHPFSTTIENEVKSWCYGLANLGEPVEPRVVNCVVHSMMPVLNKAIKRGCEFSVAEIASRIAAASRDALTAKEIAYYILAHLPNPRDLRQEEREIVGKMIIDLEAVFPGAIERCCERWNVPIKRQESLSLQLPPVPEEHPHEAK